MTRGESTINATIAADAAGWRLDRALAAARADPVARAGEGADRRRPGDRSGGRAGARSRRQGVVPGGAYRLVVPEPTPAHNEAQDIALEIVFEDDHLLVVDKPAGMVVHPAAGNLDGTLVNALLHHCAGRLSGIGGVARPGIVHRIDKGTSGLLVVAKTDRAHEGLAAQFARHSIDRRYLAVVAGVPMPREGGRRPPRPLLGQPPEDGDRRGHRGAKGR
jgi:23S rRNA pseudouridine1911/1915/1917 synthase